MARTEPFEQYSDDYDRWFIDNEPMYRSELEAVKDFIPPDSYGLEIGVGSGKFSLPFNIKTGIDPSFKMARKAKEKGIDVLMAIAEALPFKNSKFDFILIVTSICFFDDIRSALSEANRVLKEGGFIITCFIDAESDIGKKYFMKKNESRFYRDAVFYTADEILDYLKCSGFGNFEFHQTIFKEGIEHKFRKGYGEGGFVVIRAVKEVNYDKRCS